MYPKLWVAGLTPFDSKLRIDYGALGENLDYLERQEDRHGLGLVSMGTTAEVGSLSVRERMEVLEFQRQAWHGPLRVNVSAADPKDVLRLIKHANRHADELLILPRYVPERIYAAEKRALRERKPRPTRAEIVAKWEGVAAVAFEFLREVLRASELPVTLYNYPEKSGGYSMSVRLVSQLRYEFPQKLVGLKDSQGDEPWKFNVVGNNFKVFCGSDRLAWRSLNDRVFGVVTGGCNPILGLMQEVLDAAVQNWPKFGWRAQRAIDHWLRMISKDHLEGVIPACKIAMRLRVPTFPRFVRPPLKTIGEDRDESIFQLVRAADAALAEMLDEQSR